MTEFYVLIGAGLGFFIGAFLTWAIAVMGFRIVMGMIIARGYFDFKGQKYLVEHAGTLR